MTERPGPGHSGNVALALSHSLPSVAETDPAPPKPPQAADFASIYEEHVDFVYRLCRRLGVQERAAEDAVQDVFVVVHRRLGDFEGRSSVKTWLYGITRRVAKDHRRRVQRKEKDLVPAEGLSSADSSPRDQVEKNQAARLLQDILDGFDEKRREVFVLAELEEMSAPEIAEALELNVNTVYSRLRVARQDFNSAVARFQARQSSMKGGPR